MDTKAKLFSRSPNIPNEEPNTMANFQDIGMTGTLPIFNGECLDLAVRAGVAFKGQLSKRIQFDRKHFFHNSNPAGYQITQKDYPIMKYGKIKYFDRNYQLKEVRVREIVIEQDTAIEHHERDHLAMDFNRSCMPLCEIVTQPDIQHPEDAKHLISELQETLKYLKISKAMLDSGELRIDTNVSLKRKSDGKAGKRIEIKAIRNLDSIEDAIEYEMVR
jgi:aspartyl-tRNA(Asn)/glutamyl-tRNA(Gln) amidotransferase subunit B